MRGSARPSTYVTPLAWSASVLLFAASARSEDPATASPPSPSSAPRGGADATTSPPAEARQKPATAAPATRDSVTSTVATGTPVTATPGDPAQGTTASDRLPTTVRVLLGFPVFPVGLGIEQQLGPRVSAGLDGTVNFVVVVHAHVRVYANPNDRTRFFVQPGATHIQNPSIGNTSKMAEPRVAFDVRAGDSTTFTVDLGAAFASGGFASGELPALALA